MGNGNKFSTTAYDCISYTSPGHDATNSAQLIRSFLFSDVQLVQIWQTGNNKILFYNTSNSLHCAMNKLLHKKKLLLN